MIDKREKKSRRDRHEGQARALSRGYRGDKTDLLAALMKITCEEQHLQFFLTRAEIKKTFAILAIFSAFDVEYHILGRYSS